ncbi:MAG: hypothetical protein DRJ66_00560 [Thermoprotei archaeon]|nr:MAG: hypothetical protein DRJ66_00560 [Thermoprotei archaeon]RLF19452.1 MAG: hypothetical protein DRZ82_05775 [Thermoprotei archaeon]
MVRLNRRAFISLNYLILFSAALITAIIVAYYIISMTTVATSTPIIISEGEAVLAYYSNTWHLYIGLKNLGDKTVKVEKVIINKIGEFPVNKEIPPRKSVLLEISIQSTSIQAGEIYDVVVIYSGGSLSLKARALSS